MILLNSTKKNYATILEKQADWERLRKPGIADDVGLGEFKKQLAKISSSYKDACSSVPRDYRIHFKMFDVLFGIILDGRGFERDPDTGLHSQTVTDALIDEVEAEVMTKLDEADIPPAEPEEEEEGDPNVDEDGNQQLTIGDAIAEATEEGETFPGKLKGKHKDDPTQVAEAASEVTTRKMTAEDVEELDDETYGD